MQHNSEDSFIQEVHTQWQRIGQRFYTDIPSFGKIWNYVVESREPRHSADHPVTLLVKYMQSLQNTCQQALYSVERLDLFCNQETSNVFEFYVAHYIYDFLARVKTATDLLVLMIRHVFELGNLLEDEACSLEKGKVSGALRRSDPSDQCREELARKLDRARNNWVSSFYDLRNVVIHKAGLNFVMTGPTRFSQHRIHIFFAIPSSISSIHIDQLKPFASLKPLVEQGDPFSTFLWIIKSKSVSPRLTVDPVILCEELWELLSALIEDLINECQPQIADFISANKLL